MDPDILRAVHDLALTVGGFAAGKPLIEKALSPTAEYLGTSLRGLVERVGNVNILDVLQRAHQRLGLFIDDPGSINPRVFKAVIEDAAVCDDVLTKEYYAAILAAARTPDGEDDATLQLASVLRDLPVRQVRMHYVVYRFIWKYHGAIRPSTADSRRKFTLSAPEAILRETIRIQHDRAFDVTLNGLIREGVLDTNTERVEAKYSDTCIRLVPSLLGAELFDCVASGVSNDYISLELRELDELIRAGFKKVKATQREREREQERLERDERSTVLSELIARADDAVMLYDSAGVGFPVDLTKEMEAEAFHDKWYWNRPVLPENERDRVHALRQELIREKEQADRWDYEYDWLDRDDE